ncbi:MAG: cupin domain-containing protein [Bacteroidales bacterium]|nr:cupin domain-containing protein [Bacteroidales bacterium]MCF8404469.1 cupin domain-containing protein [Bacteroidales bacterium]
MLKVVINKLGEQDIKNRGITRWPIWEKEVSVFKWKYDGDEECLILEGEVVVETEEGSYHIIPRDFVTFKKGLECTWKIKSAIKKHYNFP